VPKVVNPEILPTNNRYKQDQDNDGQADYLYDASGNLTKDAQGRTFTYDAENRQTTAVGNNLSVSYAYDANDKRVKSVNAITNQTTIFVYDADGSLAAEYTINIPPPTNPTIGYLTEDALGSVRAITNSFGEIKARRDFLPFGEELFAGIGNRNTNQKYSTNGDDTRKKFATYQRDAETNLDYAQSRYYSPMQGRFTSPDEFKGGPDELFDFEEDASDNPTFYADLENPQSLNKYQYTYNNPYKYNDPTGHCTLCIIAEIALTVADVAATVQTLRDPNASRTEKVATVVGTVAGIVAPGGGYGVGAKYVVKALKGKATKTVVNQGVQQTVDQGVKQTVNQTVKNTSKKVPNPNGKKGGEKHQKKVEEVEKNIASRGLTPKREHMIKTPGGNKSKRFVDVVAMKGKKVVEMHQVGKQNKNGMPVSRERKALNDIQKATGKRPTYHPYN
jgi:RHS repeat-associated protein